MVKRAPRPKRIRRLGTPLPGLTRKDVEATPTVRRPGGQLKRRQQKSAYRRRLEEKQRVRFHYGITETQLRRHCTEAAQRRGVTGDILFSLLEHRLDNVVFRHSVHVGLDDDAPTGAAVIQVDDTGQKQILAAARLGVGRGVAVALAERLNLSDAARFASGVAALATTALGAQTALPHRHDLQTYLDSTTSTHSR